jgi:hypothetical protein
MNRRAFVLLAVSATVAMAGCARLAPEQPQPQAEGPKAAAQAPPAGAPGPSPSQPDLELSARAPAVAVVAHPCPLVLTLKNKSRTSSYYYSESGMLFQDLPLANHYPEFGFRVVRADNPGVEVGKTRYAEELGARHAQASVFEIGPGQEMEFPLRLNRVIDLSQTGDYLVSVTKELFAVERGDFSKRTPITIRKDNIPLKVVGPPD